MCSTNASKQSGYLASAYGVQNYQLSWALFEPEVDVPVRVTASA
jgi:hypothetical protein